MNKTKVMKEIKNKLYILLGFEPEEEEKEKVAVKVYNN